MARLVIYSSGAVNQTVELTGRNVRIGRAKENDVVLADATQVVSRFHAELRCEDGHYILLDLNSANGTWVWDHRIQRIVLDSGTVAEIGGYRLALETDTEATTAPPASRHPVPPQSPVVPEATSTEKQEVVTSAVSDRLAEARDGPRASRRAAAEAAMAGGAAAEQRGDFVEAQREYERASDADPASGADEALGRVRARMKTLGDDAFKRVRTFD